MPEQDTVVPFSLGGVTPGPEEWGPHVLQNEHLSFLLFDAIRGNEAGADRSAGTAIVTINGCLSTRFGYPNDEALGGHPLYRRGLRHYRIFEVLNSSWISTMAEQNRLCFPHSDIFASDRHWIFTFQDSTFECVAKSLELEVSNTPFRELFQSICERFLPGK